MDEPDEFDAVPPPSEEDWLAIKARFPLEMIAGGVVVARAPFGIFLDLGGGALGLMEMPAMPRVGGSTEVVFLEIGAVVTGVVVRHRDSNRQVELVAEDPISDFFRSLLPTRR